MLLLTLAGLLFIAIHIGVSGTTLRDGVVGAVGARAFSILFSVASIAALVLLVGAYNRADYVSLWGHPEWFKLVADVLMLPAFLLVVIGLTTPNPTSVGQESRVDRPPEGILRVTRYPFLIGVALWAGLHLLANGDLASVLFFGSLLVVSLAGPSSIDRKRRRALGGPAWDRFAARTSVLPFVAIASGRNTFSAVEFGWWRPLLGSLGYALFIGGHRHIVGVSPFPHW